MSDCVTIRTTNNNEEDVINITLEVEDGQIISMTGLGGDGHSWEVERIQFNLADQERELLASRCCTRFGCFDC